MSKPCCSGCASGHSKCQGGRARLGDVAPTEVVTGSLLSPGGITSTSTCPAGTFFNNGVCTPNVSPTSFLVQPISIGSLTVEPWQLALGAAAVYFLFFRKGR